MLCICCYNNFWTSWLSCMRFGMKIVLFEVIPVHITRYQRNTVPSSEPYYWAVCV
jgi:hypothetical protein